MASEVHLWEVVEEGLQDLPQMRLDQERRLEEWLAADISILDASLLVVGRQVPTEFGGFIDLLCLDEAGDLVVVELKRDKTPREITAQVLDYGSWVAGLSNEQITSLAESHLDGSTLDEAFAERFDIPLPETLGQGHRLLVVGSEIDGSSERIITYLSSTYGVDINAATFQHFKNDRGQQFLARVFVVEPRQVELRARTRGSSKRRPKLTFEELRGIAEDNGVVGLFDLALAGLDEYMHRDTTRSTVGFDSIFEGGARKVVVTFIPPESNPSEGLSFRVYTKRLASFLRIDEEEVRSLLPAKLSSYYPDDAEYSGFEGFFSDETDVDRFIAAFTRLRANAQSEEESSP